MTSQRQEKQTLRELMRQRRAALPLAQRARESQFVCRQLLALWEQRQRPTVAGFWPVGDEIDVRGFYRHLWRHRLAILLPRLRSGRRLSWHKILDETSLREGPLGLRQPDPRHHPLHPLPPGSLVVVPALALTKDGHRLGQGAGYFDRTLAGWQGRALWPVGVGFTCQIIESIPHTPLDIAMAEVVLYPDPLPYCNPSKAPPPSAISAAICSM